MKSVVRLKNARVHGKKLILMSDTHAPPPPSGTMQCVHTDGLTLTPADNAINASR